MLVFYLLVAIFIVSLVFSIRFSMKKEESHTEKLKRKYMILCCICNILVYTSSFIGLGTILQKPSSQEIVNTICKYNELKSRIAEYKQLDPEGKMKINRTALGREITEMNENIERNRKRSLFRYMYSERIGLLEKL